MAVVFNGAELGQLAYLAKQPGQTHPAARVIAGDDSLAGAVMRGGKHIALVQERSGNDTCGAETGEALHNYGIAAGLSNTQTRRSVGGRVAYYSQSFKPSQWNRQSMAMSPHAIFIYTNNVISLGNYMDWRLQVIKRSLFSRIPFGNSLRRLKRRALGYEPDSENLRYTVENLEQMKSTLGSLNRSFTGTILEIGSGWFPTIPLKLAMDGVTHIYMTDLTRHMDEVTFQATLDYLRRHEKESPYLTSVNSLHDLPISYLAPFNVNQISDNSLDYVLSRTVLEHIPPEEIVGLLSALRPKLAPDGLMVHLVDNSDHLEFADKSISRINFLTWTELRHSLVNTLVRGGENRLRHHEYSPLFRQAGFDVLCEKALVDKPTLTIAKSLDLQPPFAEMSAEQVSILTSIFILAPGIGAIPQEA